MHWDQKYDLVCLDWAIVERRLKVVLINYIVGAFKGNVKQTPLFHIEEIINKMIFIKTEKPQINNFVSITKQSVLQIAGVKCKHAVDSLLHHGEMWSGAVAAIR